MPMAPPSLPFLLAMAACLPKYSTQKPIEPAELWAPLPVQHIAVDGVDIAYIDNGRSSAQPPLVFIHGLGGNFTHWEHVAPPLAESCRVIGIDLPGCGDSVKDVPCTIRLYAESVVRLLDELGIPQATLVGHSLGGMVCAEAALEFPSRVRRLVLMDAAGFFRYPRFARAGSRVLFQPWLFGPIMQRFALMLLDNCFHERNARVLRFIGQAEGRPPQPTIRELAVMSNSLRADLVGRHYLDDLHRLTQPALVIWGDEDRLIPFKDVPSWAHRLPNARLEVIRGCGHLPLIERPDEVVASLRTFVAAAEAAPLRRTASA